MLGLLLEKGQSYGDLSTLLGISEAELRKRARAALAELGGAYPDRRLGLTDYLLVHARPLSRSMLTQRQTRLIDAVASCAVIVIVAVLAVAGVFSGGGSSGSPTTAATGGSAPSAGGGSSHGGNGGSLGSLAPIKLNGAGGSPGTGVATFGLATGDH